MDSKEKFASKCKEYYKGEKSVIDIEELRPDYEILFKTSLVSFGQQKNIFFNTIYDLENANIYEKGIIGKENVPMSKIIEKLNNNDWVKTGMNYLDSSEGFCPFCQQTINESIKNALLTVFDESYETECKEFENLKINYIRTTSNILDEINACIKSNISIINFQSLDNLKNRLANIIDKNMNVLNEKSKSPSINIHLISIIPILEQIKMEIDNINKKIKVNNELVINQAKAKNELINKVWDIISNNLLFEIISNYEKKRQGINAGINELKLKQDSIKLQIKALEIDINKLQAQTSSIDHAINEINSLLKKFSFTNFKFVKNLDNRNYKIVREDDSDVRETLSEGEHRFITFLYFYQLIKGNIEAKRSIKNKIIVIDDPISSLDSNILFIISTLVKEIISDCLSDKNLISQVFILTHNIYFHQEIAYKSARENRSPLKEKFWIIKKNDNKSIFIGSNDNKIKTSYELLWKEIKDPSFSSSITIFNTLRRILEYYYKIIGNIDYENCIKGMEKEDKLICKSLLSFINDGSHMINDDFVVCYDSDAIKNYLNVFEKIFRETNQGAHYDMMMSRNY